MTAETTFLRYRCNRKRVQPLGLFNAWYLSEYGIDCLNPKHTQDITNIDKSYNISKNDTSTFQVAFLLYMYSSVCILLISLKYKAWKRNV